jgi:hypothetical protein
MSSIYLFLQYFSITIPLYQGITATNIFLNLLVCFPNHENELPVDLLLYKLLVCQNYHVYLLANILADNFGRRTF